MHNHQPASCSWKAIYSGVTSGNDESGIVIPINVPLKQKMLKNKTGLK
jgi:hypothetical protein